MATINPYLNFPGNTEEAFNFYKSVFGGDFAGGINRFGDMPESGNVSESDKNKIMHVGLPVGKNNMLMATDALESMGQKL
ncbi:MAG: VOC family protein, partial [Ignavibacteriales bacterium]